MTKGTTPTPISAALADLITQQTTPAAYQRALFEFMTLAAMASTELTEHRFYVSAESIGLLWLTYGAISEATAQPGED